MIMKENLDVSLIIRPTNLGVVVFPSLARTVDGVDHLAFDLSHGFGVVLVWIV